jgi:hypothetical protein
LKSGRSALILIICEKCGLAAVMPDLEHGFEDAVLARHEVQRSLRLTSQLKKREVTR